MLRLPEAWVWDFWLADDGERFHLFFLYASRALHDPDRRHYRASVGHAVSADLRTWERVADALVRSDGPAFDDLATWTGSVVRHPDGSWRMFYTGATLDDGRNVQRIGVARSRDLMTWERDERPLLAADGERYEVLADGAWHDEAFRDPWVFEDPDGDGWHMLVTARGRTGPAFERGVVGHATSPDLDDWTLQDPRSDVGQGFGQLEVMQVERIDGVPTLLFSCLAADMPERTGATTSGGIWAARGESELGPFDIAGAQLLTDDARYSGRVVRDRDGRWMLLAFLHSAADGTFVGAIDDPTPIRWHEGHLVLGDEALDDGQSATVG